MGLQTWQEALFVNNVNGTAITGSAAEALVFPDIVVPAGYMTLGKTLRLTCYGQISNVVTTPGTVEWWIRWGGLAGVVLATTAAPTMTAVAQTNLTWTMQATIVCRSVGATGTFMTTGFVFTPNNDLSAAINGQQMWMMPASAPAVVTVDTTIAKNLSVTAKFSLTTASMTGITETLEAMN